MQRICNAKAKTEVPEGAVAEGFTTKGKLTKTIQTPRGAKEIYDPVQDEEIKTAFKRIYDKQYDGKISYYTEEDRKVLGDKNIDLLFRARDIHQADAMRLGCKRLLTFECGREVSSNRFHLPPDGKRCDADNNLGRDPNACEHKLFEVSYAGGETICIINGKTRPNAINYPTGFKTRAVDAKTKETNFYKTHT